MTYIEFLSTLSLRRATGYQRPYARPTKDFYPRSPCGERHRQSENLYPGQQFLSTLSLRRATTDMSAAWNRFTISIHALLAESDTQNFCICVIQLIFLSTLSLRRATAKLLHMCHTIDISIHALLAESDIVSPASCDNVLLYFYPRSPCGERQHLSTFVYIILQFLSTLSLRRATILFRR